MKKPKMILGIETSCDETSASVCRISVYDKPSADDGVQILSNIVASSAELQAKYGGVVPEQAAREQLKSIIPAIEQALLQISQTRHPELVSGSVEKMLKPASRQGGQAQHDNKKVFSNIDAIAVTQGPGLIGSLLVGVETAKTLSLVWNKPLIPVNHLIGHFYANWIDQTSAIRHQLSDKSKKSDNRRLTSLHASRRCGRSGLKTDSLIPSFPCLGLLVSGGHTDLVLFTNHGKYKYLGGTRDDAAGECFDKCARLLGLPYPGGPIISKLAQSGNPQAFNLPRPMIDSDDWDFSFSGLKTAVVNLLPTRGISNQLRDPSLIVQDDKTMADLAASIEQVIVDVLIHKTLLAAKTYQVNQIMIAGGVAANQKLAKQLICKVQNIMPHVKIFIPPPYLCTDNAAYIATAAFYNYHPIDPLKLQANPSLSLTK